MESLALYTQAVWSEGCRCAVVCSVSVFLSFCGGGVSSESRNRFIIVDAPRNGRGILQDEIDYAIGV